MEQIQVLGRHALLFDDDATAAFINSPAALLEWNNLLIDRYDVRHLLQDPTSLSLLIRRKKKPTTTTTHSSPSSLSSSSELDHERFRDLRQHEEPSLPEENKEAGDSYQAVAFSYGENHVSSDLKKPEGFHPPFPVPESLLLSLPPTEKVHQIIARTAMFVSKNGGQSEIILRVKQGDNPTFGFLMPDHNLHAYFRFLVDHPELSITNKDNLKSQEEDKRVDNEQNQLSVAADGALSLLGSAYGYGEDDDETLEVVSYPREMETVNGAQQQDETDINPSLTAASQGQSSLKKECYAPASSSHSKIREAVGFEAPPSTIPQPTSDKLDLEFHLDGRKRAGDEIGLKETNAAAPNGSDLYMGYQSKAGCNSEKKEKFKMIITGTKKEAHDPPSLPLQLQRGTGADAALTVSLRNLKSNAPSKTRTTESTGISTSEGERASSIGSFSCHAPLSSISKPASNGVVDDPLPDEISKSVGKSKGEAGRSGNVSVAKAIAETAALVAASEADSSEACLTRDQKQKAERLKRAKMFAAMIKSNGPQTSSLLPRLSAVQVTEPDSGFSNLLEELSGSKATKCNNDSQGATASNRLGPGFVDSPRREREGSSLLVDDVDDSGKSDRLQKKDLDDDKRSSRKKHKKHEEDSDKDDRKRSRKRRHRYKDHRYEEERKSRRSISKDSKSRHRHHKHNSSSSEDEHRDRIRLGSTGSSKQERSPANHLKLQAEDEQDVVPLDSPSKLQSSSAVNTQSSDAVEVPDDLRAKIRAMLLANM